MPKFAIVNPAGETTNIVLADNAESVDVPGGWTVVPAGQAQPPRQAEDTSGRKQSANALQTALQRVRVMLRRARDDRAALPPPAERTAAQRRQARDATNTIQLCRAVLVLADAVDSDDLDDGDGSE